ncbi:hypothetical protein AL035_07015 [Salipiger aestuarii]|uniref:Transposase n=1 Tax=Salipiger aestuarii TaxID=568098 RepID=A0A327YE51_9RHOB|nr:hypothetical protein AL035_07015 [Salipiger aestuarii]RAK18771.1 transposase [Salipiger aestuarii]
MTKRQRYSAEFRTKTALEARREDLTTAGLSRTDGSHPTMIGGWTKTATANMASAFDGVSSAEPTISERNDAKLHARIGHVAVGRGALPEASGLIPGTGGKTR